MNWDFGPDVYSWPAVILMTVLGTAPLIAIGVVALLA